MELKKKIIHMNKLKGKTMTQVTLDEDFNLPENKADMSHIIMSQADTIGESVKVMEDKAVLKGKIVFEILYASDSGAAENYSGTISFEEAVHFDGLAAGDYVQPRLELEDMTVSLVNSRKMRVNGVVNLELKAESLYDEAAGSQVEGEEYIQTLARELDVVQIKVQKKDTFRIREEIEISGNKPNIAALLWRGVQLRNMECRPLDGKLNIRGEALVFVIYAGEEEHIPLQWMEKTIAFSGEVEVPDCEAGMVCLCGIQMIHKEMEAKPDYDGENRMIAVDLVLELDMKLYAEEKISILSDVYSPVKEVVPRFGEAHFQKLLVKNGAKCKIADKITMEQPEKILQICNSTGVIRLDRTELVEDGLKIEGALDVTVLYMSANDKNPLQSFTGSIPFSYVAEAKGIREECFWQITPALEQLTCVMLGNNEIEVRASLLLELLVMEKLVEPTIMDLSIQPIDQEKLDAIAGITGYLVKPGDTLWGIARQFYTTVEAIQESNGLPSDRLKGGERLLLIRQGEML